MCRLHGMMVICLVMREGGDRSKSTKHHLVADSIQPGFWGSYKSSSFLSRMYFFLFTVEVSKTATDNKVLLRTLFFFLFPTVSLEIYYKKINLTFFFFLPHLQSCRSETTTIVRVYYCCKHKSNHWKCELEVLHQSHDYILSPLQICNYLRSHDTDHLVLETEETFSCQWEGRRLKSWPGC